LLGVTILGATGSIGKSTLDVIKRHKDKYFTFALTANTDVDALEQLCIEWQPRYAVMNDESAAQQLSVRLSNRKSSIEVLAGVEALQMVARMDAVDIVVAAIVGSAGLLPTLSAVNAGKRILLANKEALIMSGHLFMDAVEKSGAVLLPVDSEHNAIFQCLPEKTSTNSKSPKLENSMLKSFGVTRILLTASGGPFRTLPLDQLNGVTPEQAVNHPNWVMGRKISVDSATMINKGFEVIEARWLFDIEIDNIEVVIHPQSVIHSMVSYVDGSMLAQLGNPDMRTPIAHALAWPERIDSGVEPLDVFKVAGLEFERPDFERFPCLRLSYEAIKKGGTASAVLNAANEVAVAAFLDHQIPFTAISKLIEEVLSQASIQEDVNDLEVVLEADRDARILTNECMARKHYA
jgi:1-deoxy-D-xylulose-5-phosphate reductoisomerase